MCEPAREWAPYTLILHTHLSFSLDSPGPEKLLPATQRLWTSQPHEPLHHPVAAATSSITRSAPQPWGSDPPSKFALPWALSLTSKIYFSVLSAFLLFLPYHHLIILYRNCLCSNDCVVYLQLHFWVLT